MSNPPPELHVVADFLAECLPFDELSDNDRFHIAAQLQIQYHRKGHRFTAQNTNGGLRIIRTGAAEIRDENNQLIERVAEGESFNLKGLLSEKEGVSALLIEDTLLYFLPEERYQALRSSNRHFNRYFHSQRARRVRRAARYEPEPSELIRKVHDLMSTDLLTVPSTATIRQTAEKMSQRRISSALIVDGDHLKGIVTDRDIRSRVVAPALSVDLPVTAIMSSDPEGVFQGATLFDAILFMTQRGFHHIPVFEEDDSGRAVPHASTNRIVGIVTASDLMLARQDDPVFLVQHIVRQKSVESLQKIASQMPNLLVQWVSGGVRAYQISRILTAVSDAITRRLIELAIVELGPAPVPFSWLGFGSQGRSEQLLGGDQDNGLLISDNYQESLHGEWFKQLAHRVCDGLNDCGYTYCNGLVMATTDEWRQPLAGWCKTVDRWTRTPTKDAVMRVSIFFDIRSIYGDATLCEQLQQHMLTKAKGNSIFLAALAENVLDAPPPLGIFRRFVVEHNGEHRDELNLKACAVMPIVDIARIHSLANGLAAVNSTERLQVLARNKVMAMVDSRNLQDAWSVIMQVRLQHQAQQISQEKAPSNYINPDNLSKLDRRQLRDAFSVVSDAFTAVRMAYRQGMG